MNMVICHTKGHKIAENEHCRAAKKHYLWRQQNAQSGQANSSKSKHPHTDAEGLKTTTTTARIIDSNEWGRFVECGIYILANSVKRVVSNLGCDRRLRIDRVCGYRTHDPQPQRMFTILDIVLCWFCSRSAFSELSELHSHPSLARRLNSITFPLPPLSLRL